MSAIPDASTSAGERLRTNLWVMLATTRVHALRYASNPIQLIRVPLAPVLVLGGYLLAYNISGQTTVPHGQVIGFLVIGIFMTGAWSATVWGAGNALQAERYQGTISAVIAAPASTAAVVIGYTFGSLLIDLPSVAACLIVGLLAGGHFGIADPLSPLIALALVYCCTVCIGIAFGGLFILSRNSNSLSNFLQLPVFIVCGFYVPRSVLPGWVQAISDAIPLAHAADVLRGTTLESKPLTQLGGETAAALGTAAVFLIVGIWALGRADRAIRRSGTLDIL